MIYDLPEPSSPISQGDIFFSIPILDLTDDELPVIDDEGSVQTLPWETFASAGEQVSAIISVRPTIAIVGTQECDALRAPNITLFEVRPFRDVERKSKDTSKASKWVPLITQHARVNQKWFYLPEDEQVGFGEKMGADFLTPIRIPRIALERLINFRKGRLNEVAKQHFRERLAEFFRRYAYDEWYPLTRDELAEYQKNHPDAEPFPWQRENRPTDAKETALVEVLEHDNEKGFLDFLADAESAAEELADIISTIDAERRNVESKLKQHTSEVAQLNSNPEGVMVRDYKRILLLAAADINTFSEHIEEVLPNFTEIIRTLDASYSAWVSLVESQNIEPLLKLRNSLSKLTDAMRLIKESLIEYRDEAFLLRGQNINKEFTKATSRRSQALNDIIICLEEVESFALKVEFKINEKFEKSSTSEDKDE